MVKISLKDVEMQDCQIHHCTKVSPKTIRTICCICNRPAIGWIIEGTGYYAMDCHICLYSANACHEMAEMERAAPGESFDRRIFWDDVAEFVKRVQSEQLLRKEFNAPLAYVSVRDSDGDFILSAEVSIFDQVLRLNQNCGPTAQAIRAAVDKIKTLGLEVTQG